jgi:hypothetical protein
MQLVKQVSRILLVAFGLASLSLAAEPLKSSIQPGERIKTIFEPLNINGEHAGEPHCLVCENGLSPVAMLFAREPSEQLVKLLVKIDAATAEHQKQSMGSFVVFLSDKPELQKALEQLAKKQKFKHLILATFEPAGPEGFAVAEDAALTVVLYNDHIVRANHAFRKGELTDKSAEKVLADLPKIFEESKR